MPTYGEALANGRAALTRSSIENAALDARLLLAAAAGLKTAALIARDRDAITALENAMYETHIERRLAGEPVARILGETEFWGLPIKLNAATLMPRPDTETLVHAALREARRRRSGETTICDLGTGSGAIAIALLHELPQARATATDISEAALAMARLNAERLGVSSRLALRKMDFGDGPDGPFDIVLSNPPYVRSDAISGLQREVRDHDPRTALDGGSDGLAAYRAILGRAGELLGDEGFLALEVGYDQAEWVAGLCRKAGLVGVTSIEDLAGIERVVTACSGLSGSIPEATKKALGKVG